MHDTKSLIHDASEKKLQETAFAFTQAQLNQSISVVLRCPNQMLL